MMATRIALGVAALCVAGLTACTVPAPVPAPAPIPAPAVPPAAPQQVRAQWRWWPPSRWRPRWRSPSESIEGGRLLAAVRPARAAQPARPDRDRRSGLHALPLRRGRRPPVTGDLLGLVRHSMAAGAGQPGDHVPEPRPLADQHRPARRRHPAGDTGRLPGLPLHQRHRAHPSPGPPSDGLWFAVGADGSKAAGGRHTIRFRSTR